MFAEDNSQSELQAINTDFTFELFICAAILLDNRESLMRCRDDVQLIHFTSRFVYMLRRTNHCAFVNLFDCVGKNFAFFAAFREHWT